MSKRLPTMIQVYGRRPVVIVEMTDERLVMTARLLRAQADVLSIDVKTSPVWRALEKELRRRNLKHEIRQDVGWIPEQEATHVE